MFSDKSEAAFASSALDSCCVFLSEFPQKLVSYARVPQNHLIHSLSDYTVIEKFLLLCLFTSTYSIILPSHQLEAAGQSLFMFDSSL